MKETKRKVGRPRGYKFSEAQKQQISESMKRYYTNMTEKQRITRENCNKRKSEIYQMGLRLFAYQYGTDDVFNQ